MNIRKLTFMQSRQKFIHRSSQGKCWKLYFLDGFLKHIFGTRHLYFFVPFFPFRTFLLYFFQFCTFTFSVTLMRVTKLSIRFQQVDLLQTIEISAVLFWSIFVEFFHVFLIWLIDSEKVTVGFFMKYIKTGALHRLTTLD